MAQANTENGRSDTSVPSERIVDAIAEERGVDPLALPPLYEAIDPDALNRLFETAGSAGGSGRGRVVFTAADCEVVVHRDGRVDVTALADTNEGPPVSSGETAGLDEADSAISD